jgi:hypothetical protein
MSATLRRVQALVDRGDFRMSAHGYDRMAGDRIPLREVVAGLPAARAIEDYPDHPKGPCVLVLQRDGQGEPVHVVWGIPGGREAPGVLVTAYRPAADRWDQTFMRRQ